MLAVSLKWRLGVVRRRTKGTQDWVLCALGLPEGYRRGERRAWGSLCLLSGLGSFLEFYFGGIPMVLGPSL